MSHFNDGVTNYQDSGINYTSYLQDTAGGGIGKLMEAQNDISHNQD